MSRVSLLPLIRKAIEDGHEIQIAVGHWEECPEHYAPTPSGEECNCGAREREARIAAVVEELAN